MDKEKILEKSRKEKFDEAQESYAMKGIQTGFSLVSLLFVIFYLSCAFTGKTVVWKESLLAMYMVFFSSIGYALYRFNRKKFYLVQFLLGGTLSLILSIATVYWIWVK